MTEDATAWAVPPLTATGTDAVAHYRAGIAALVAGISVADRHLAAAIGADPDFALAHIGLAVCRVAGGASYRRPPARVGLGRGERQHVEIVDAAMTGAGRHADDLRREHLLEFPGDLLIVWLPVLTGRG